MQRRLKKTCARRETLAIAGFALKDNKFDGIFIGRQMAVALVYAGKVDQGFEILSVAPLASGTTTSPRFCVTKSSSSQEIIEAASRRSRCASSTNHAVAYAISIGSASHLGE